MSLPDIQPLGLVLVAGCRLHQLRILATVAALASAVIASPANAGENQAATSVTRLAALTVTANKMEESLKDTPQSVTLVTAFDIEQKQIRGVADLVREIPNMSSSFVYSEDVNFRGLNSSTFTNANPVVIYVDGVPQSSRYAYEALLENVERVEILRGPQGSLYGKDAIGGVIAVMTKTPGNEWSGSVGTALADQSGREFTLSANGAISENRLFLTLGGKFAEDDGWITNAQPGMDANANRREERRGKLGLLYRFSPTSELRLQVSRDDQTNHWIDGGLSAVGAPLDDYTRDDAQTTAFDFDTVTETVSEAQSLAFQHKFERVALDAVLTNKSIQLDGDYDNDWGTDSAAKGLTDFQHSKIDTQTQELRLSGGEPERVRWVAGLYHEREKFRNLRYGGQYAGAVMGMPFDVDVDAPSITRTDTQAVFGQVGVPLGEAFDFSAGGRWQRIDKEFDGDFIMQPVGTTGTPPAYSLVAGKKWTTFLPKAALSYKLNPSWTAYLSLAEGYMPGGFNYYPSSAVVADNRFEPQTSTNYELGLRSTFGRFYLSASVFHLDIADIHVYSYDSTGLNFITSNAGKATSRGAEVETSYRLDSGWQINGSLGVLRATYDEYPTASVNGNWIEKTPAYTGTIGLQYTAKNGFYARADVRGEGRRYYDPANTLQSGAYATLDLKVGYRFAASWEVYGYSRNVTDTDYVRSAMIYRGGRNMVTFGEPRRIAAGVRYSF